MCDQWLLNAIIDTTILQNTSVNILHEEQVVITAANKKLLRSTYDNIVIVQSQFISAVSFTALFSNA